MVTNTFCNFLKSFFDNGYHQFFFFRLFCRRRRRRQKKFSSFNGNFFNCFGDDYILIRVGFGIIIITTNLYQMLSARNVKPVILRSILLLNKDIVAIVVVGMTAPNNVRPEYSPFEPLGSGSILALDYGSATNSSSSSSGMFLIQGNVTCDLCKQMRFEYCFV